MPEESTRYICPVCDHEIRKGQKICPNCHSRVRNPWIYTGGNLPNEALDSEGKSRLDFMDPRNSRTRNSKGAGSGSSGSSQNAAESRSTSQSGRAGSGTSRTNAAKSGTSGHASRRYGRRGSGCGPAIVIIIVFLICISVVFGFC